MKPTPTQKRRAQIQRLIASLVVPKNESINTESTAPADKTRIIRGKL